MRILVNGVRLFVEVLGPKLLAEGPRTVERPTVVALHGGPPFQDELEAALVNASVRRVSFPNAGHFLHVDAAAYTEELRNWVTANQR